MIFIYNMKIRMKLLLSFGIMIIFMGIIGYTGFRSVKTIQNDLQTIFTVQMPSIDFLIEADRDLQQLLVAERSLLFTDPESNMFETFLKDYNSNFEQSDSRWKSYKKLARSEKETQLFDAYDQARSEWEVSSRKVVDLVKKKDESSIKQAKELTLGETNKKFENMRDYINQLTEINLELAKQSDENAKNSYHATIKILGVVILLGILVGLALCFGISKLITAPVNEIVLGLKDIAQGEGDLTKRLDQRSKDEIGELASWFNAFMDKLQGIIKDISQGISTLSASSTDLSTISEEMTQGAQNVSSRSDTVAAGTEEMSSNMSNVAAAMEQSSTNTDTVATAAEEMNATINEIAQNAANARNIPEKAVIQANNSTQKNE